MKSYSVYALENFPLITPGDDVPSLIVNSAKKSHLTVEDGDIIVIAQKILSKAENRIVALREIVASKKAKKIARETKKSPKFTELILRETNRILKVSRDILLVEDRRGLVCINAGIDKSNVKGRDNYALLPEDPDHSAETCRLKIRQLTGKSIAVIVCDTYSRAFRRGQVNFAIGLAGICPFRDYRGKKDLFGLTLKVKNTAVVDEIASAAELLIGQGQEETPVVIFKGLKDVVGFCERCKTRELFISEDEDLFKGSL